MSEIKIKEPIITLSMVVTKSDGTIEDYGIVATNQKNEDTLSSEIKLTPSFSFGE